MILAQVSTDGSGILLGFQASGHAGQAAGSGDPLCAAFSALARTAWETLGGMAGSIVEGRAEGPGDLAFRVIVMPDSQAERARGATDFLLTGLRGLERDFPGSMEVRVSIERRS